MHTCRRENLMKRPTLGKGSGNIRDAPEAIRGRSAVILSRDDGF
jgi:hypothetical protein